GQLRAVIAVTLIVAVMIGYLSNDMMDYVFPILLVLFVAAMVMLRAWKWFVAAALLSGIYGLFTGFEWEGDAIEHVLTGLWIIGSLYVWGEYARSLRNPWAQIVSFLTTLGMAGICSWVVLTRLEETQRW